MRQHIDKLKSDPVSSVIFLLLLVSIPHFRYIPWWSILSVFSLLSWRLFIVIKPKAGAGKLITVLFTLLFSLLIYNHAGGFSGIVAGSHLLLVMTFLKLLESRCQRDYMLLVILSLFIIATNLLFSQTLPTALYMLCCVFITLVTLLSLSEKSSRITLFEKLKTALRLTAFSLPLMLVLFVFFPRISGQLWHTNDEQTRARSGLSDSMEPGKISQLVYSNERVFRADFATKQPEKKQLYWRALTLWHYDGKTWENNKPSETQTQIHLLDTGYKYTITVEASNNKWLYLLDLPVTISNSLSINTDFTALSPKTIRSLFQYSAHSASRYYMSNQLDSRSRSRALKLPGINTNTIALAQDWKRNSATPEAIIKKALTHFTTQNFYYTLSPAKLRNLASVDEFLFETRQGFCEHYASSFAVLMRAAGIPSRVVLGYLGGEANPYNNIISVDQSMAHAWNEVWIDNRGWIRIDPTASIAPHRVSKDIATALKGQQNLPLHLQLDFAGLQKIRQLFDAIDNKWNQWILNYNESTQKQFIEILSGKSVSLHDISYLFIKVILGTLVLTVIVYFLSAKRQKNDAVTKAYQKFLHKFENSGFSKRKNEGPADYTKRLESRFPQQSREISRIMNLYIELKFRKIKNADSADRFISSVRHFRLEPDNINDKPNS
ncbi:MAG: DUF3488 and transglutaminase-like domain-containing protein [Gammaproteobacteria bacterium]|nr:DUF3488 and transglutaminase-like domain-containing protein [Gammaproteobacteria bacterium]